MQINVRASLLLATTNGARPNAYLLRTLHWLHFRCECSLAQIFQLVSATSREFPRHIISIDLLDTIMILLFIRKDPH